MSAEFKPKAQNECEFYSVPQYGANARARRTGCQFSNQNGSYCVLIFHSPPRTLLLHPLAFGFQPAFPYGVSCGGISRMGRVDF